jgi:hypothetical protein
MGEDGGDVKVLGILQCALQGEAVVRVGVRLWPRLVWAVG